MKRHLCKTSVKMAPRKIVPTLEDLSILTLQKLVNDVSDFMIKNDRTLDETSDLTEHFRVVLYDRTPWLLHNRIAELMLMALSNLYHVYATKNSEISSKCETILKLVLSAIPYPKLKKMSFNLWARPIQLLLLEFLGEMSNLEILNCDFKPASKREASMVERALLVSCHSFSNLVSFTFYARCTDEILAAICENCKSVRRIDVSHSRSVTDASVKSLVLCQELQKVELFETLVTRHGYYKLLTESKSPNLVDIGECSALPDVLKLMESSSVEFCPYQLPCLHSVCRCNRELSLVCKYFPNLTEFSLWFASDEPNLMCLSKLENLKCLKLRSDVHITEPLCSFLSVKGWSITSLCLVGVHELRDTSIVNIAVSCPNIENLQFSPGWQYRATESPAIQLSPKPFQKLRKLVWESYFPSSFVEFILNYAHNLETLRVRPSMFVTDQFLQSVFNCNPMKRLKELNLDHSNKLSAKMVRFMIINFEHISYLAHFSISLIKSEFESIENFIVTNNYNVVLG